MTAAIYDEWNRPYHTQHYENAAEHARGAYLDTLEIAFAGTPDEAGRARIEASIRETAGRALVGCAWSRDAVVYAELRADVYDPARFRDLLAAAGWDVAELRHYYAARLDPDSSGPGGGAVS